MNYYVVKANDHGKERYLLSNNPERLAELLNKHGVTVEAVRKVEIDRKVRSRLNWVCTPFEENYILRTLFNSCEEAKQ